MLKFYQKLLTTYKKLSERFKKSHPETQRCLIGFIVVTVLSLTEVSAQRSPLQAFYEFRNSSQSQLVDYDVSKYEPVAGVVISLQLARYIIILLGLKYRAARRIIYGSESIILTLQLVLPNENGDTRAIR